LGEDVEHLKDLGPYLSTHVEKKSVISNTGHFFCFNSTVPMLIACNMFLSLLYNFITYKNDQGTYRNWIIGKTWRIIKYVKSNWDFVTIISYLQKGLDLIQPNLIKIRHITLNPLSDMSRRGKSSRNPSLRVTCTIGALKWRLEKYENVTKLLSMLRGK
jgi:hypothetical protein